MLFDGQYFNLDYTHDEIEALLDKINNGYVLSTEEYNKLLQIGFDNISSFSGDYNDLINKPDFIEEVRNAIQELKIETSDTVEQKLAVLKNTIEVALSEQLENKAEKQHSHEIEQVNNLQELLSSKAEFLHTHDNYVTSESLDKELNDLKEIVSVDLTKYVTRDIMDDALNNKANKAHDHVISDINNLQEELDNKANKNETLTEQEINAIVSGKADLNHEHDAYYKKVDVDGTFVKVEEYLEYLEDFAQLSDLATKADIGHEHDERYYSKEDIDKKLADVTFNGEIDFSIYAKKADVDIALVGKAELIHNHAITDVSGLIDELNKKLEQSDMDQALANKSDKEHTHAEYVSIDNVNALLDEHKQVIEEGITEELLNYATKEQLEEDLSLKADYDHRHDSDYAPIGHEHDMSGISGLQEELDKKANVEDVATKEDLSLKADIVHNHEDLYYSKEEVDNKIEEGVGNIDLTPYAKVEDMEAALATKAESIHTHDISSITNLQEELDKKINADIAATKVELEEGLSKKSDNDHNHDDDYAELIHNHTVNDITDLNDNFYNKSEVESLVATKAELKHEHDISEVKDLQNALDLKALKSDVYTKVEIDEQMSGKSDIDHVHDDRYYLKQEVDDAIAEGIGSIDLTPYATNEYVNAELAKKSDVGHGHKIEEIEGLQNELNAKADIEDVYDKTEIDDIVIDINAKIDTKADADHAHDDIYSKLDHVHKTDDVTDLFDHVYNKNEIEDFLAEKSHVDHRHDDDYAPLVHDHVVDEITDLFDNVHTKDEIKDLLAEKSDIGHGHKIEEIEELQNKLDAKADMDNVYNKTEIDAKVEEINEAIDGKSDVGHGHDISDIEELQDNLDLKANVADVYNKTEIDTKVEEINEAIDGKSDVGHGHDIAAIEGLQNALDLKANAIDVYNKTEIDTKVEAINEAIDGKSDVGHGHDIAAIEGLQNALDLKADKENTYTKNDIDNAINELEEAINSKSDSDHNHDDDYAPLTHNHVVNEVTDLFDNVHTKDEIEDLLAEKSDGDHNHDLIYSKLDHNHLAEDVTDLYNNIYNKQEINDFLADKSDSGHNHDENYAPLTHDHLAEDITNLYENIYNKQEINEALAGKSDKDHIHDISVITGLQDALDLKASIEEMNTKASKEELETGLLTKSDTSHKHDDVYAPLIHNHDDLYYTETEIDDLLEKAIDDARIISVAEANAHSDEVIANLIDSAPDAMNTLNELAKAINDHQEVYDAYVQTVSEALSSKSDSGHDHNTIYYTKQEVDNKVFEGVDGIDFTIYALKSEMNTALAAKAELEHTHEAVDITDLQEILDAKADSINAATKEEFEALESLVASKAPAEHNHNDDYYTKAQIDENITNRLNSIDHSAFALKTDLASKADAEHGHDIAVIAGLQAALDSKIDSNIAATKTELTDGLASKSHVEHIHEGVYLLESEILDLVDGAISNADLAKYATIVYVDEKLDEKSDVEHTHDISEINNLQNSLDKKIDKNIAATLLYVDTQLSGKADVTHFHDDYYAGKYHNHNFLEITGLTDYAYSKIEMTAKLAEKADVVHKHEISDITGLISELETKATATNVYTKSEIDAALSLKADVTNFAVITNQQIDDIFSSMDW